MNKHLVRGLAAAALALGSLSLTACPAPAPYVLPTTAGAEINDDFWSAYYPEFKKDMTWTYKFSSFDASGSVVAEGESVWKIVEVNDGAATVKINAKLGETTLAEETTQLTKKGPSNAKSGFKFQKTKARKIGGVDYPEAVWLSSTNDDGTSDDYWVVKGVGIVAIDHNKDKTYLSLKSKSF
ncbi:hypothetical protein J7643_17120 [bacterium]|nr:hypothetical protein [bacterium]